ncbi:EFR1 family ferrodoxin [Methanomicrobium antiquum]|uniref:EFR1 family ferrodoxin n=1 Tax=Methanomicrobium antiquum TaxID=487686 RepID=A0AAF0JLM3_9EURY|nr:EFR1 family ferrodoxin [Methanomicrobium antiquum]WFN36834.1 EFR1 family ferrodoxin [Methanomicrobium antiquum]
MKILIAYFSATGNTRKIADFVFEKLKNLGADVEILDITPLSVREKKTDLSLYDAFLFGMPVHSWRAPRIVRNWLKTLDGCGRKCSMFFTYGGFSIHPAHYTTCKILEERGFLVVSSAEFLAAHTFNLGGWEANVNRPDERDFSVAEEYAKETYLRFSGDDYNIPKGFLKTDYTPYFLDEIEKFRFRILTQPPYINEKECIKCGICEDVCPTGAMNAKSGKADLKICIACLGCVSACPNNAVFINDMSESFACKLSAEKITKEDLDKKESRIYL